MGLEADIKKAIKKHEKKNKVNVVEVTAYKTRTIGFKTKEELSVNWLEK